MELHDILKQLKTIEPDAEYARRSKERILAVAKGDFTAPRIIDWRMVVRTLQSGTAIALAGILLLIAVGGFSVWTFLKPFGLAGLDPAGLRAEAQAIDIQLQIAGLEYEDLEIVQDESSGGVPRVMMIVPSASSDAPAESSTSSEDAVGVDDALEILSK